MNKLINKKSLGILISLVFIGIIVYQVDMEKTIQAFSRVNPLFILPIIPIYLLSFVIRAYRWKTFLSGENLKFMSLLSSIFIGFSLNCILPARAGEIYRAYFFSKKENLNRTKVFTSVILERFFDGFVLFTILVAVIYLVHKSALFFNIAYLAGLIFLGGLGALMIIVKLQQSGNKREKIKSFLLKIGEKRETAINKAFSVINSFFEGLKTLDSYRILFKIVSLTFLIWVLEGSIVFLVIKSFGIDITYLGAFLVLTVTAFSSLIPAGPAAIGPYQWGYIIALNAFNIQTELAFAISIVNQLILILIILSAGVYFMWKDHITINEKVIEDELNWT